MYNNNYNRPIFGNINLNNDIHPLPLNFNANYNNNNNFNNYNNFVNYNKIKINNNNKNNNNSSQSEPKSNKNFLIYIHVFQLILNKEFLWIY